MYFYPRSPCGERHAGSHFDEAGIIFLSTLSLRRATSNSGRIFRETPNFYPRSPCGERPTTATTCVAIANFYPRSPCGERPAPAKTEYGNLSFLSTLSLRRATQCGYVQRIVVDISIHALLAESDAILGNPCAGCPAISIHALLAESDPLRQHQNLLLLLKFLSTLSLRRATRRL